MRRPRLSGRRYPGLPAHSSDYLCGSIRFALCALVFCCATRTVTAQALADPLDPPAPPTITLAEPGSPEAIDALANPTMEWAGAKEPPYYPESDPAAAKPVFEQILGDLREGVGYGYGWLASPYHVLAPSYDIGIGHERLVFAPSEIDTTQPFNNYRFRLDAAHGFPYPDRSEYLWSKPGKGPPVDTGVSYQDIKFLTEVGGNVASVATEIPIRLLDPNNNPNTAGMGDMNLATKLVLLDGKTWQLTQIFRTYFNTGASKKGLGSGHVSMEPGLLWLCRWRPDQYLYGEMKYWFPLGGDLVHSGQVLRGGLGYSLLLFETDDFAVIHTDELIGYWFLDGAKFVGSQAVDVDNESAFHFYPGLRLVFDRGCDFGLLELGMAGTFSMGRSSLFDGFLRTELRFSY